MMTRRSLLLALVVALPIAAASGQQVQQLPRVAPTTGLADSSLFLCVDSTKTLTRACKFSDVQKRLAFKSFDSLVTGNIRVTGTCTGCAPAVVDSATGAARAQILTTARTIGGVSFNGSANIIPDSATGSARSQTLTTARALWGQSFNGSAAITGSLTGVGDISGGASSMNLLAGTGASRRLVLQTTTSGSAATTFLRANELQQSLHADGLVATPSIGFAADSLLGFYRHGTAGANDTLALSTNGINTLNFTGGATAKLVGGAGNMAVQAGTGNSRTLTLQSTTSAGTAKNTLVLGADTSATFLGQVIVGINGSTIPQFTSVGNLTSGFHLDSNGEPKLIYGGAVRVRATTGSVRLAADTTIIFNAAFAPELTITGGATPLLVGGAGNMIFQAGTGASRTLTLQATNAGSVAANSLVIQDSTVLVPAGRVGQPGLALTGFTTTGLYHPAGGGISVAAAGTESMNFTNSSVTSLQRFTVPIGSSTNPGLLFQSQNFTGLYAVGNGSTTDSVGISSDAVKTLTIGGGANAGLVGGAGNMTILAGTGNSRTMTLQSTTSAGTTKNTLVLGADTSVTAIGKIFTSMKSAAPVLTFGASNTGFGSPSGTDTVYFSIGGSEVARYTAGGTWWIGNGGAAATPAFANNVRTTTGISWTPGGGDSLIFSVAAAAQMKLSATGGLKLPLLPAEGSTKNAMCWDGVTFQVTQNAAATCTVSSARFKENIVPLSSSDAWQIVAKSQLHSSTYNERVGGRKAIGIIAEQADSADTRLASRDAKGIITSTNYEEVTSLLLMIVKDQQRQLDSIKAVLRKGKP